MVVTNKITLENQLVNKKKWKNNFIIKSNSYYERKTTELYRGMNGLL